MSGRQWRRISVLAPIGSVLGLAAVPMASLPSYAAALSCGAFERIAFDPGDPDGVTWVVPDDADEVRVRAAGGRGGSATATTNRYRGADLQPTFQPAPSGPRAGGLGAVVTEQLPVRAGETLVVVPGGGAQGAQGGVNGGGDTLVGGNDFFAGGGGGASDVRQGGSGPDARVIVAGGGGGTAAATWWDVDVARAEVPPPSPPPGFYGAGGDAGRSGGTSGGYLGGVASRDGQFQGPSNFGGGSYSGQITGGRSGALTAAGDGGTATVTGGPSSFVTVQGDAGVGPLGGDGDGSYSASPFLGRAIAGGGGGGYYGGGSGSAVGFGTASLPTQVLASGGGGGSSLGEVTGLNGQIDGYVDLAVCTEEPDPPPTDGPDPTPGPDAGGVADERDPRLLSGADDDADQASDAATLPDTGTASTAAWWGLAALGAGTGLIVVSRRRHGRGAGSVTADG
ncbi:MAG: LPXTG cell wall anchor domain-containing protein [Angustibacter sp.]